MSPIYNTASKSNSVPTRLHTHDPPVGPIQHSPQGGSLNVTALPGPADRLMDNVLTFFASLSEPDR